MLKKNITLNKMNVSKNALIFLLRAPTNHSFSFNLGFIYEVKHKFCLSKTVCGTFNFQFCFIYLRFIYLFNKMHGLFDFKIS